MRHWTPEEIQEKLRLARDKVGGWGKLAKICKCDRTNLYEAGNGKRACPRRAAKFLGFERVTAYVKI